jgi:vacuolar-type H+-ATPase subunit I/STV1
MQDNLSQLDRIEQLLREGNTLRSQAVALQQEVLLAQKSLLDEQRANLAKASQLNDQAEALQRRARRIQAVALPAAVLALGYVAWLLLFGLNGFFGLHR